MFKRLGLALVCLCGLCGCTQVFFQPHRLLVDTPDRYGIPYENETLISADGTRLNAWFLPAQGVPKGTMLFLHGNAENISTHFHNVLWLPKLGYNILALDYRGYGASAGLPTLAGAQDDIDAAFRHLLTRPDVDPKKIAIFGQSLGGAFAIYYSAHSAFRQDIKAVVVDSAFSDYRRIANENLAAHAITWAFQWAPWLLIDNDYSPEDSIAEISPIPLLIIHGGMDNVVPERHAERLFSLAKEPKELFLVPAAGHIQAVGLQEVRQEIVNFLEQSFKK
jgi:fermentation-respiration switch protein FrsA (DUF1100 family)